MKKNTSLIVFVGMLLGVFLTTSVSFIYAQVSNNVINGCIRNGTGLLRVITTGNCGPNETPLSWNQQGPVGATGASGTGGSTEVFGGFTTTQLIGYDNSGTSLDYRFLDNANFSQANFPNAIMRYASAKNANFTSATFQEGAVEHTDFSGSNFTNAQLEGGSYKDSNFSNVNFTGATIHQNDPDQSNMQNTNFTNANFTNAVLSNGNFSISIFTNAIWSNTTCPDGTNSNNNGDTCEGHLVP